MILLIKTGIYNEGESLPQGKRIIDDIILKMALRSETAYENTRFVLPRERLTYIVTSIKRV